MRWAHWTVTSMLALALFALGCERRESDRTSRAPEPPPATAPERPAPGGPGATPGPGAAPGAHESPSMPEKSTKEGSPSPSGQAKTEVEKPQKAG